MKRGVYIYKVLGLEVTACQPPCEVTGDFLDFEMFEEFCVGDEGEVQAVDILRG